MYFHVTREKISYLQCWHANDSIVANIPIHKLLIEVGELAGRVMIFNEVFELRISDNELFRASHLIA